MNFTYYGHSCFSIESVGTTFLFDPFITGNELTKGSVDANTGPADYILVSHGHGDHVADLVSIAQRTHAQLIAAYEVVTWAQEKGVANAHPINLGSTNFGAQQLLTRWHVRGQSRRLLPKTGRG